MNCKLLLLFLFPVFILGCKKDVYEDNVANSFNGDYVCVDSVFYVSGGFYYSFTLTGPDVYSAIPTISAVTVRNEGASKCSFANLIVARQDSQYISSQFQTWYHYHKKFPLAGTLTGSSVYLDDISFDSNHHISNGVAQFKNDGSFTITYQENGIYLHKVYSIAKL